MWSFQLGRWGVSVRWHSQGIFLLCQMPSWLISKQAELLSNSNYIIQLTLKHPNTQTHKIIFILCSSGYFFWFYFSLSFSVVFRQICVCSSQGFLGRSRIFHWKSFIWIWVMKWTDFFCSNKRQKPRTREICSDFLF